MPVLRADTHFALDFVRPEHLMLRVLMRALGESVRLARGWQPCRPAMQPRTQGAAPAQSCGTKLSLARSGW